MSDDRGLQFDILDKSVAARGYALLERPFIRRQDYDNWLMDYNQLASYAEMNSDNHYVARQWAAEKPRYANAPNSLFAKIRTADPSNYNTAISISGGSDCGCGRGSNIPMLPFFPSTITPGNFGAIPSRGQTNLFFGSGQPGSLGDNARNLLTNPLPFFPTPTGQQKLVDKTQVTSGIIVALIVGAILWGVHYFTKQNVSS